MKKSLIGGFLTLSGTIGTAILLGVAGMNPASGWETPPGRFICTILENGTAFPLLGFLVILVAGLLVLGGEYFRKDVSTESLS